MFSWLFKKQELDADDILEFSGHTGVSLQRKNYPELQTDKNLEVIGYMKRGDNKLVFKEDITVEAATILLTAGNYITIYRREYDS